MLVLCVDDDSDILSSMRTVLEANGCKVETAGSAEAGIRRFNETKPDMVFVDLMMEEPDSGLKLIRHIRGKNATIPIYLLSSAGESLCSVTDCTEFKVEDVLQKPISTAVLVSLIKSRRPKN